MKNKKTSTLLLLHAILLVYSCSGIFSKTAAYAPFLSFKWIFCYGVMIVILGIYAVGWQQVIKSMPLNTAYINKSVTMIWAAVWGVLFFNEKINITFIVGGVLVMIGVLLIVTEKNESTD